jgi:hypothetical protein
VENQWILVIRHNDRFAHRPQPLGCVIVRFASAPDDGFVWPANALRRECRDEGPRGPPLLYTVVGGWLIFAGWLWLG